MAKKKAQSRTSKKPTTKKTVAKKTVAKKTAAKAAPKTASAKAPVDEAAKRYDAIRKKVRTPLDLLHWELSGLAGDARVLVGLGVRILSHVLTDIESEKAQMTLPGMERPTGRAVDGTKKQTPLAEAAKPVGEVKATAESQAEAKPNGKTEVSEDQLITLLGTVNEKKGLKVAMGLLEKYGVKRVPELPVDKRPGLLADAQAALA